MRAYLRDALLMAMATGISRLFGLARDAAIADRFGASAAYDAFVVAFFVPHLLRRLLAEGALSSAFVPVYTASRAEDSGAERLASNVLTILLLLFPIVVGLGVLLAPAYVPFLASGFDEARIAETVSLTRILLPFIALVGFASVFTGVLNAHHRFLLPALAPVLFNVGMIVGATILVRWFPDRPILGLAVGALLGGTGQLLLQLPAAMRLGLRLRLALWPLHPGIRRMARLMTPAVLALAVTQINLLVDNKLASHLGAGSISSLQYATRLFQLPLGVFAVSVASALLPRFSDAAARGRPTQLAERLRSGLLAATFVLLPSAVGLLVVSRDAVAVLFEHGRFTAGDTLRTASVLSVYVLGIVPYGLTTIMTRAFYAQGRVALPLLGMVLAVATNVAGDLLLVRPMGIDAIAQMLNTQILIIDP
ncbi:MAG: murein biosynthesis integral membrane protein MurJ [Candidatus Bipolaricaulota bacterium]|nr:MAG: murein biosynthesis integral membrane protein MurJ [Candidatus Bipolaricaulota bacterium]